MGNWRQEADKRYKERSAGTRFKLVEGENCLRVLPRKDKAGKLDQGPPWEEYYIHRQVGPNERYMTCGKNFRGEGECWLCDTVIPKLKKSEKDNFRARASKIEAVEQFLVQVAIIKDGQWSGPMPWVVPSGGKSSVATKLLGVMKSQKKDFVSFQKGYNLNIERTGTGYKDTRYGSIISDEDPSQVPSIIVQKMKTMEELVEAYSKDKQEAAYFGREVQEDNEQPEGIEDSADSYENVGEETTGDETTGDEGQGEDTGQGGEDGGESFEIDGGEGQGDEGQGDETTGDEGQEDQGTTSEEFEDIFNEDPPAPDPKKKKQELAPPAPQPKKKQELAPPAPQPKKPVQQLPKKPVQQPAKGKGKK